VKDKLHHQIHVLWTKAVGTPDYDKREWEALYAACANLPDPPESVNEHRVPRVEVPKRKQRELRAVLEELCPGVTRRNWPVWAGPPLCMAHHPLEMDVYCELTAGHEGKHCKELAAALCDGVNDGGKWEW
jgi:hypothetical protein